MHSTFGDTIFGLVICRCESIYQEQVPRLLEAPRAQPGIFGTVVELKVDRIARATITVESAERPMCGINFPDL